MGILFAYIPKEVKTFNVWRQSNVINMIEPQNSRFTVKYRPNQQNKYRQKSFQISEFHLVYGL